MEDGPDPRREVVRRLELPNRGHDRVLHTTELPRTCLIRRLTLPLTRGRRQPLNATCWSSDRGTSETACVMGRVR